MHLRPFVHRRRRVLSAALAACLALGFGAVDALAVNFTKYRVPATLSPRAARDIEFHWSDTYTTFGVPLVPPGGGENDLDRLGIELCESIGQNPFGYGYTDLALAWDFFKANRSGLYHWNTDGDGFVLDQPSWPAYEKNHVDAYVYMPAYASDPPYPPYPNGDTGNGTNYGVFPSVFTSATEDSTSTVYHFNSLMIPGPRPSKVGDTGPNRWPRQSGGAISNWIHEFQHLMNVQTQNGNAYNEFFSEAAQTVTGGVYDDPLRYDIPYTWSFGRGTNYAAWRQLAAYLAFNFRGQSMSAREDDLLWRWGGAPSSSRNFAGLAAQLNDAVCAECATKPYFTGLGDAARLQTLLHNWRIANYVNQPALADGQYGYPASFGYSPANDVGAWQNIDGLTSDDNVAVPANLTADPTWRTREYSTLEHPANGAQYPARPLTMEMFGSEYFVIHPSASLGTGGDTLVIRVSAEGIVRRHYRGVNCAPMQYFGGKLFASAVTYSTDHDSLFRHPEWATGVTTVSVDVDSVARDLELVVTGFASTHKAVLVVLSLVDNDGLYYSSQFDLADAAGTTLPIRFSAALRKAPFLATNPNTLVQTAGAWDDYPSWSPDGTQIAFHSRIPSSGSYTQVYRVPVAGGAPTVVAAQPQHQMRPDWSPRGDLIAWEQDNGQAQTDIWVCGPGGTGLRKLTNHTGFSVNAAFGIDGQQVAYFYKSTTPGTPWELWRIQLDGTGDLKLATLSEGSPGSLRWSPDGNHLYFTRGDSLYAVPATGGSAFSRHAVAPGAATVDFNRGNGMLAVGASGSYSYYEDCLCPFGGCTFGWGNPMSMPWTRVGVRDTTATGSGTRWRFTETGVSARNPRYSFDGTRIAYAADPNVAGERELAYGSVTYNHAPTFTGGSASDAWLSACIQWNRYLTATDRDGETITYRALKLPPGAQWISPNRIRWTPVQGQLGDYYVVVRAEDPSGGVDNRVIKLTVGDEVICEDPCPPHIPNCYPAQMQPTGELPKEFALAPAEPNPASDAALIRFSVPHREQVEIDVLDIQGRIVRRLVSGVIEAGYRHASWDRRDAGANRVGAGVYFYRMRAGTFVARRKLILLP